MFWKRPKVQDEALGVLTYKHGGWLSAPLHICNAEVLVSVSGDRDGPDPSSLEGARSVLAAADAVVQAALRFATADRLTQEFTEHQDQLVLDGFSFEAARGRFDVEFGLSEWPDGMVTVTFHAGVPHEVLLAD